MYCRHCDTKVPDGTTICPNCGKDVTKPLHSMPKFAWVVSFLAGMAIVYMVVPLLNQISQVFGILFFYGSCAVAGLAAYQIGWRAAVDGSRKMVAVMAAVGAAMVWLIVLTMLNIFNQVWVPAAYIIEVMMLLPYGAEFMFLIEKLF